MQGPVDLLAPQSGLVVWSLVIFYVAVIGVPAYFAVRFIRAYERRSRQPPEQANADARIEALEAQVEQLADELQRLAEGQQFTAKLLEQRSPRVAESSAPGTPGMQGGS